CLTLITYHFGDGMGQRFHNVAGAVEVVIALGAFFVLDWILTRRHVERSTKSENKLPVARSAPDTNDGKNVVQTSRADKLHGRWPILSHCLVGILMLAATAVAAALTPKVDPTQPAFV